jgi:hypothetical protein
MLSSGPVPSSEILTQARAQGFSERTLRRARKMLAVKAYKTIDKMWMWSMPEEELSGGQVNNSANGHLRA